MARHKQPRRRTAHLSRWQKAGAAIPVALLVGAWTAAITNPAGLASTSNDQQQTDPGVPEVPTTAFGQPASVQAKGASPTGIDRKAGLQGTISTLSSNGIPAATLLAHKRAETLLAEADPACGLPWTLVAAIGRVESDHGRFAGNRVGADGVSRPGIYGVPLDGSDNTASIGDTDNGALDDDPVWDRAVGPMQFIPSTWDVVGVDANGDGDKNPQDVNDAALASGVYLCAGTGDLSDDAGARSAVTRYNHSTSYVDLVLSIARAYAAGDFSQTPNNQVSPTTLTSQKNDQALPKSVRDPKDAKKAIRSDGPSSGGPGGGDTSAPDDDGSATPGDDGGGDGSTPAGNNGGGDPDGGDPDNNTGGGDPDNNTGGGDPDNNTGGGDDNNTGGGGSGGGGNNDPVEDVTEPVVRTIVDASLAASMCADELRNQYGEAPQEAINRCAGRLVGKTVENAEAWSAVSSMAWADSSTTSSAGSSGARPSQPPAA